MSSYFGFLKLINKILLCFRIKIIEFLDLKNIGLDTNMRNLCQIHIKILDFVDFVAAMDFFAGFPTRFKPTF